MKRRTGKIPGAFFGDAQSFGRIDAGSRASFTSSGLHRHGPRCYILHRFCMTRAALKTWAC